MNKHSHFFEENNERNVPGTKKTKVTEKTSKPFPSDSAIGSLMNYISESERKDFQPMNINFGIMPLYDAQPERNERGGRIPKKDRRIRTSQKALENVKNFLKNIS